MSSPFARAIAAVRAFLGWAGTPLHVSHGWLQPSPVQARARRLPPVPPVHGGPR